MSIYFIQTPSKVRFVACVHSSYHDLTPASSGNGYLEPKKTARTLHACRKYKARTSHQSWLMTRRLLLGASNTPRKLGSCPAMRSSELELAVLFSNAPATGV